MPAPQEEILANALTAAAQAAYGKVRAAVLESLVKDGVTDEAEQAGFIEIILALIPVLLPIIMDCFNSPERAARAVNNPGPIQRRRLWKEVEKELPERKGDNKAARKANDEAREVLYNAVLAAGKKITPDDVKALAAQAE